MEPKVEKAMMISFNPESKTTLDHNPQPDPILNKKPKKSKNIFKVALLMMRGHSRKSRKAVFPVEDESKNIWRKIVGSMRPMHLQSNNQSPPQIINGENNLKKVVIKNNAINSEDGFDYEPESWLSPSPNSSRYASATNSLCASAVGLNEMVEEEKEKEEEIVNKDNIIGDDGDDMIDAKAEEFIAQFYQDMRLQLMDIDEDHDDNEISMRSLGL